MGEACFCFSLFPNSLWLYDIYWCYQNLWLTDILQKPTCRISVRIRCFFPFHEAWGVLKNALSRKPAHTLFPSLVQIPTSRTFSGQPHPPWHLFTPGPQHHANTPLSRLGPLLPGLVQGTCSPHFCDDKCSRWFISAWGVNTSRG